MRPWIVPQLPCTESTNQAEKASTSLNHCFLERRVELNSTTAGGWDSVHLLQDLDQVPNLTLLGAGIAGNVPHTRPHSTPDTAQYGYPRPPAVTASHVQHVDEHRLPLCLLPPVLCTSP